MKRPFMEDDELYEDEEEMEDELDAEIDFDGLEDEDEELNQISSYWKNDSDSGYRKKRKLNKFSYDNDY